MPGTVEHPGEGLLCVTAEGDIRLGSRAFCHLPASPAGGPELCLTRPGARPAIFTFAERLRADAVATVGRLQAAGMDVRIASGDQPASVARIAAVLRVAYAAARQTPAQKAQSVAELSAAGRRVLMVGDGLNDSPCLAAALVSAAPASAADLSQTVADVVYQGEGLAPVAAVLTMARRARRSMIQNLALSAGYNGVMLPLAALGYVTPWVAAIAMSGSSLVVISNALRLQTAKLEGPRL
jgi:Cu2+-exporting ATPase